LSRIFEVIVAFEAVGHTETLIEAWQLFCEKIRDFSPDKDGPAWLLEQGCQIVMLQSGMKFPVPSQDVCSLLFELGLIDVEGHAIEGSTAPDEDLIVERFSMLSSLGIFDLTSRGH